MNEEFLTEEVIVKALTDPKTIKMLATLIKQELISKTRIAETAQIQTIQKCVLFAAVDNPHGEFMLAKEIYEGVRTVLGKETDDPAFVLPFTLNQFSRGLSKLALKKKSVKGVMNYFVRAIATEFSTEKLDKLHKEYVDSTTLKSVEDIEVVDAKEVKDEKDPAFPTDTKEEVKEIPSKKKKKKKVKTVADEELQKVIPATSGDDMADDLKERESKKFNVLNKKELKKMSNKELKAYLVLCKDLEPDSAPDLKLIIKKIKRKRK